LPKGIAQVALVGVGHALFAFSFKIPAGFDLLAVALQLQSQFFLGR
jgi:hypothetical protein